MKWTMPMTIGADDTVWVFVDNGSHIDATRVATWCDRGGFIGLSDQDFPVDGLVPLHPDTHEPLPGLRWATTADVDAHTDWFGRIR